jgi:Uma2 family endonuclease
MKWMAAVTPIPRELDERLWRLSVDRYHAMIEAGILTDEDRVELLEGVLVEKMSKKPPHVFCVRATSRCLSRLVPAGWYVPTQDPLTLEDSEPEPDLMIVRGTDADYLRRHPTAADIGLVVEVADSSISRDRGLKKRIYATAGIATYWLIDLNSRALEIYTAPNGAEYSNKLVLSQDQEAMLDLDGQHLGRIPVKDLYPRSRDSARSSGLLVEHRRRRPFRISRPCAPCCLACRLRTGPPSPVPGRPWCWSPPSRLSCRRGARRTWIHWLRYAWSDAKAPFDSIDGSHAAVSRFPDVGSGVRSKSRSERKIAKRINSQESSIRVRFPSPKQVAIPGPTTG